ncbi:hypothetical protein BDZ45DRAFT_676002 [Acephala macrosclerotiorum]|nr:hypothetical protein BDZ45DRAFT_676002 [Acephala macrosclerotiorum]
MASILLLITTIFTIALSLVPALPNVTAVRSEQTTATACPTPAPAMSAAPVPSSSTPNKPTTTASTA